LALVLDRYLALRIGFIGLLLEATPDEPSEQTQKTQPKKGDPVEIPIPSKDQVVRDFEKVVSGKRDEDSEE
jgi:hypothetical protein